MDHRIVFALFLLVLATSATRGSGTKGSSGNKDGKQENTEQAVHVAAISVEETTKSTGSLQHISEIGADSQLPESVEEHQEKLRDEEKKSKEEIGEEYEGEDEDEYEEELKAVAESHEAMSKDDTKKSNISPVTESHGAAEQLPGVKSFDSYEVMMTIFSDEDMASNEAITDEVIDKNDQEVAELQKYKKKKKKKNENLYLKEKMKMKRVPTVKKELSTQKEILIASNETQLPKSLLPPRETLNRLGEDEETIRRRNADGKEEKLNFSNGERKQPIMKTYDFNFTGIASELGEEDTAGDKKKPEKREELKKNLKNLKTFLLSKLSDLEKKLENLRTNEALTNPREEKLLNQLQLALQLMLREEQSLESIRRYFSCSPAKKENELAVTGEKLPALELSEDESSESSPIPRNSIHRAEDGGTSEEKLKKKMTQHRMHFTSTTTNIPMPITTPTVSTTTETPQQATSVHWKLVAEKLFGPPLQQDLQEDTDKSVEVQYPAKTKTRVLPSTYDLKAQESSKNKLKTFKQEKHQLMRESVQDLDVQGKSHHLLRELTRQSSRPENDPVFPDVYERRAENDHNPDYDVAESYQRQRYDQMVPPLRELPHRSTEEDYQDDYAGMPESFIQDYQLPPRELRMSRSWPEISYKYEQPWKSEDSRLLPISNKWPWMQSQSDYKYLPIERFLQPERHYWFNVDREAEFNNEFKKMWPQRQRERSSWDRDKPNSWMMWKEEKTPSWHHEDKLMKDYDRVQKSSWEKSKNRSELDKSTAKQDSKDKVVLQVTMKTWNSLTSDPATWPYKLPGAKPWPKDENGKSYNPNADLVKKLGLDKETNTGDKDKNEKALDSGSGERVKNESLKTEMDAHRNLSSKHKVNDEKRKFDDYKKRPRTKEREKPWPMMLYDDKNEKYESVESSWSSKDSLPKIQSMGAWVMPADQSTWKPYPIKPIESLDDGSSSRRWPNSRSSFTGHNELGSWQQKINDDWSYGKSSVTTGSWPSRWKQFAYHRVTAIPISKPGTTADSTVSKGKSAFVAVSAVSSPKYGGNDWRKTEEDVRSESTSGGQTQVGLERPLYAWKKETSITRTNSTDPLENQLEALRQIDFWPYKENEAEKDSTSTTERGRSTSMTEVKRTEGGKIVGRKENSDLLQTHERAISMK